MNKLALSKLLTRRLKEFKLDDMCVVAPSPIMSDLYVRILPSKNRIGKVRNKTIFTINVVKKLRAAFPLDFDRVTNAVCHIEWGNIH